MVFWDNFVYDLLNINTANSWGLSVWGKILSVPQGIVEGDAAYRKLLKAFAKLLMSRARIQDYEVFFSDIGLDVTVYDDGRSAMPYIMTLRFVAGNATDAAMLRKLEPYIPYSSGVHDNNLDGKMLAIPDDENMIPNKTQLTVESAANNPLAGKLDESSFNWNEERMEVL